MAKLLAEVDAELLTVMNSQPKGPDHEQLSRLQRQVEELQKAIDKGSARYLKAPSELLPSLEKELVKMRQQLDATSHKIAVLKVAEQEGGLSPFMKWWTSVRPHLVKVSGIQWGQQQTMKEPIHFSEKVRNALSNYLHGKPGRCRVKFQENGKVSFGVGEIIELDADGNTWQWNPVEFPVQPEILSEPEVVRELLHKLGVTVKLYWKPKGNRYFELDRARLKAELKWDVAGRSNRRSRARSRDRH